jgi:hypothetical protein
MTLDFPHDAFLTDEFLSVAAIFTPEGGQASNIRVCFTLGVEDVNLGGDIVPQGAIAQAGCKSSDVPGARNGDVLSVGGVEYRVLRPQPEETGWAILFLGKRY